MLLIELGEPGFEIVGDGAGLRDEVAGGDEVALELGDLALA